MLYGEGNWSFHTHWLNFLHFSIANRPFDRFVWTKDTQECWRLHFHIYVHFFFFFILGPDRKRSRAARWWQKNLMIIHTVSKSNDFLWINPLTKTPQTPSCEWYLVKPFGRNVTWSCTMWSAMITKRPLGNFPERCISRTIRWKAPFANLFSYDLRVTRSFNLFRNWERNDRARTPSERFSQIDQNPESSAYNCDANRAHWAAIILVWRRHPHPPRSLTIGDPTWGWWTNVAMDARKWEQKRPVTRTDVTHCAHEPAGVSRLREQTHGMLVDGKSNSTSFQRRWPVRWHVTGYVGIRSRCRSCQKITHSLHYYVAAPARYFILRRETGVTRMQTFSPTYLRSVSCL
jgi:hypothetical protein